MSISGITTTMPSAEQQYAMAGPQQTQQAQPTQPAQQTQQVQPPAEQTQTNYEGGTNVTMDAPTELMATANPVPNPVPVDPVIQQQEQAEAAVMTGVGQGINITA